MDFPCDETISLKQSYRVPPNVQMIADRVISKVERRVPKLWAPRQIEGEDNSVQIVPSLVSMKEVMRKKGKWLILARDNYILGGARKVLRDAGIYYAERKRSYGVRTAETWEAALPEDVFKAAHTYWTFKNVGFADTKGFMNMLKFMNRPEDAKNIQDERLS